MNNRTSCAGCAHDLGGGQCGVSLEDECGAGGFQAWRPRTVFGSLAEIEAYKYLYGFDRGFSAEVRPLGGKTTGYNVRWA